MFGVATWIFTTTTTYIHSRTPLPQIQIRSDVVKMSSSSAWGFMDDGETHRVLLWPLTTERKITQKNRSCRMNLLRWFACRSQHALPVSSCSVRGFSVALSPLPFIVPQLRTAHVPFCSTYFVLVDETVDNSLKIMRILITQQPLFLILQLLFPPGSGAVAAAHKHNVLWQRTEEVTWT